VEGVCIGVGFKVTDLKSAHVGFSMCQVMPVAVTLLALKIMM
jgi:hypothetical protein